MRLSWAGADWQLLPDRALFAEDSATLIVADAHFGKAATFRARGVPVPHGTTACNLDRLTALVQATRARAVVFLGDLFHAREAHARDTIAAMTPAPRLPRSGMRSAAVAAMSGDCAISGSGTR